VWCPQLRPEHLELLAGMLNRDALGTIGNRRFFF
jgi:hypothetical protein